MSLQQHEATGSWRPQTLAAGRSHTARLDDSAGESGKAAGGRWCDFSFFKESHEYGTMFPLFGCSEFFSEIII